jgi:hypothetical protein
VPDLAGLAEGAARVAGLVLAAAGVLAHMAAPDPDHVHRGRLCCHVPMISADAIPARHFLATVSDNLRTLPCRAEALTSTQSYGNFGLDVNNYQDYEKQLQDDDSNATSDSPSQSGSGRSVFLSQDRNFLTGAISLGGQLIL